jgi:hypothetical protein
LRAAPAKASAGERGKRTNAMTTRALSIIHDVMASEADRNSGATLTVEHDRTVENVVTLTQIAAPPMGREGRRSERPDAGG